MWILQLLFYLFPVLAGAASLTASWVPPTENTDGTPLTDLAGYEIYVGIESGVYDRVVPVDNPALTEFVVENLEPGIEYFVVMTAVNEAGIMSAYSNEVSKVAPFPTPNPPTELQLTAVQPQVSLEMLSSNGSPRLVVRQTAGLQIGRLVTVDLSEPADVLAVGFGSREALRVSVAAPEEDP